MEHEIKTDKLVEAVNSDWDTLHIEVTELLKSYGIPQEQAEHLISEIKKKVKKKVESKIQGLLEDEWLIESLTKLYIKITHELLTHNRS
jgi:hypothetical protein